MSCQCGCDDCNNVDRSTDKSLIGNSVHYRTNPDMINKTACDLQSAQMANMFFLSRKTVVFPHTFNILLIAPPVQMKNGLRQSFKESSAVV